MEAISIDDWPRAEAVLKLLGERRDWPKLAAAYRQLLDENPTDPALQEKLWRGLGAVYRDELRDDEAAILAFETLARREPPKVDDCLEIAVLHERNRRIPAALEAIDATLRRLPHEPEPYKRRFDLCAAMGDVDGAFRSAASLVFLSKADVEHLNFYADHRPMEPRMPERTILPAEWLSLVQPGEDGRLTEMLDAARTRVPARPRMAMAERANWIDLYRIGVHAMLDRFPAYELASESIEMLGELVGSKATTEQLGAWRCAARAALGCAGLLLVGDPKLVEEELKKDPEAAAAVAACFASGVFGRLRSELASGLTPPAW